MQIRKVINIKPKKKKKNGKFRGCANTFLPLLLLFDLSLLDSSQYLKTNFDVRFVSFGKAWILSNDLSMLLSVHGPVINFARPSSHVTKHVILSLAILQ